MESSSSYSADSHHLTPPPSNIIDDVFLLPDHLYLALSGDHHHQNNFPPHTFAQHTAHSSHFPQSQSQSQLWNHHHHHTHTSAGTGTGTEDSGGKDSAGFTTPMFLTQSPHPQANSHPFAFNPPSNGNPAGPHLQVQPSRCLHDDPPPAMIHTGSSPYTTGITPTGSRPTTFEFDSAPSNQQYQHHHHQPAQPQAIGVPSTAGSATTADLHGSFFSNFSPSMSSSSPYAYAHSPSQHTTSSSSMGAGASAMGIGPGTSFGGGIGAGGGGVGGLGGGGSGGGGIDFGAGGSTPATSIFSLASSVPQSYSNHGHAPPASMQHPHLMAEAGSPTAALAMLDRRGSGTHAAAAAVGGGGGGGQYADQSMSGVSTSVPPSFHFGLHHAASMQAMAKHTVAAEGEGGMNFDPLCPSSSVVSAGSMGRQQQQQHRRHRSSTSASPLAARRLKDRSLSRNRAVTGASTLGKRASPALDQVEGGEIEEDQHGCDGGGAEGTKLAGAGGVGKAPSTRSRAVRRASIGPAAARAVGGVRGRSGSISHRGNGSVPSSSHPHQGSSGAEEAQAHQSPSMNAQVGMYNNSPPSPSISFFQSFGHHPSQHQLLHHPQGGMDSSNASSAQDSPMSSSQQSQSAAAGGCMLGGSGPGSAHSGMFEMGSFPYQHQQQFRSSQSQSQSPASSAGGGGGGEAGPAGATPSCSSTTTSSTAYLRHHHHYHHPSASGNAVSLSSVVEEGAGSSSMQGVVKREEVDVRDDDDDDDDDNDEGEGEAFEYDAAGDDGDEDFVDEDQEQDGDAQAKGGEKKKKNSNVSNGRKKGGSGVNEEDDEQGAEPSNKTRSAGTTTKAKATTGKKAVAVGGGKRVTIASKAKVGASLVTGDAQAGGGEGNREAGDGDTTITKAATTGKVVGATAKKGRAGAKEKDPEAEAKRLAERRRRRRESHNAVERRRRDTINEKITELATLLPEAMLVEAIASSTSGGNSGAFDIAAAVKTLSGVEEEGERERRETEKELEEEEVNESGGLGVYSLPPLLCELVGGAEHEDDGQGGYHAAKAGTMMSPQTALAGLPFLSISGGGDNKQVGGVEGMNVLNGFGSFSSNGVVNGGGVVGGYGGAMSSFQTQGLQGPVGMNTAIPRHILNWATAASASASAAHAHHAASGSNNTAFKNDLAGPSSSSSVGMGPLNPTLVYAAALAPVHRDSAALAAAQAKPNKGIILRKSVDYIRHLQQFLDMQMGINQALEAEVQALRSLVGEACDAGRGRATTTLTNDLMHDSAMANATSTMPNHMAGMGGGQQSGYQQVRSQPLTKLGSNQSRSPPKSQVTALFGGSEGGVSVPPALTSLVDSLRDVPAPTSSHTLGNNVVVLANPGPGLGSNGITHSGRRASPPPPLPPQASPETVGSMTGATTVGSVDGTSGLQPWMGVEYDSRTGLPRRPSPEPESIAGAAAVGKQQQQQHQQQSQQADGRVFSPASASSLMRGAAMSIQAQGQSGFLSPTFSPAGSGATAAFMMHSGGGNLRSTHHHAHGQQQHGGYGQRHGHLSVNTNGQNRNFPNASAGGVEIERGRSRTRSFHPSMSSANNSEGSWPELKASAALSRATSEERLPSARMTPAGFGSQSRVASLGRVASPTSPTSPVLGGAASRHHGGGAGGMHHGFVGLGLDEFFAHLGGVGGGVVGLGTESHSSLTGGGGGGGGGNGLVAMEE
ncbi:hypothetical protein A4X13_0g1835 [Tilletia indica]|uniref:Uncharacterized protein n=1 Tax=Tilletia indica TaxID=43049 RepID=A0A177TXF4_9BASI|nr:hypothetical protein A4X13_0g1835 [Tilletia indica]